MLLGARCYFASKILGNAEYAGHVAHVLSRSAVIGMKSIPRNFALLTSLQDHVDRIADSSESSCDSVFGPGMVAPVGRIVILISMPWSVKVAQESTQFSSTRSLAAKSS